MFYNLLAVPDPRPSKSNPKHRSKRKQLEKEHGLDAKDLGVKVIILAILAGLACFPTIEEETVAIKRVQDRKMEERDKREREIRHRRREQMESVGGYNRGRGGARERGGF